MIRLKNKDGTIFRGAGYSEKDVDEETNYIEH
jgi:hypothetical protein